jgi:hypothetical protein
MLPPSVLPRRRCHTMPRRRCHATDRAILMSFHATLMPIIFHFHIFRHIVAIIFIPLMLDIAFRH